MKAGETPSRIIRQEKEQSASARTNRGARRMRFEFHDEQGAGAAARNGGRSPETKDAKPGPDFYPLLEESS